MTGAVTVLVATHDGEAWIDQQMRSILDQHGVDVHVVVSDDASTDATPALLERWARDPRVTLLPSGRFGSPQANFYRLIADADVAGADGIAFADQDDVWLLDKLSTQLGQLDSADAVSSNVTAVFPRRRLLLDKAQPQRALDFVFESAGPGCTFLLSPSAFTAVREVVVGDERTARTAAHDWLTYAVVRAKGMRWHIDSQPTVEYRQHGGNAMGANVGLRQASVRMRDLRGGDYRRDCALIAEIAADVAEPVLAERLELVAAHLRSDRHRDRKALLRGLDELRRRPRDRAALRLAITLGIW